MMEQQPLRLRDPNCHQIVQQSRALRTFVKGVKTIAQSKPHTLMRTLITLTTEHDRPALIFVAICLWSRGTRSTRADLRRSLGIRATADTITGDLQTAADDRYLDLLHWAIRTTTSLTETTAGPRHKSSRPALEGSPATSDRVESLEVSDGTPTLVSELDEDDRKINVGDTAEETWGDEYTEQ